jgi:uncharacterized protein (DUF2225 family)
MQRLLVLISSFFSEHMISTNLYVKWQHFAKRIFPYLESIVVCSRNYLAGIKTRFETQNHKLGKGSETQRILSLFLFPPYLLLTERVNSDFLKTK